MLRHASASTVERPRPRLPPVTRAMGDIGMGTSVLSGWVPDLEPLETLQHDLAAGLASLNERMRPPEILGIDGPHDLGHCRPDPAFVDQSCHLIEELSL